MSSSTTQTGTQAEDKPPKVLAKLVTFSLLMAFVPIATYFLSAKYVFPTSNVASAINAVVAANVILVGYVVVAFKEDAPFSSNPAAPIRGVPGDKVLTKEKKKQ